jgi:hypothetical protein
LVDETWVISYFELDEGFGALRQPDRYERQIIDQLLFRLDLIVFVVVCSGRFWYETGSVAWFVVLMMNHRVGRY